MCIVRAMAAVESSFQLLEIGAEKGLGFEGLGFRVEGLGFEVYGWCCRV